MNYGIPIENFRIDLINLHITTKELEQLGITFERNSDSIEVIGKTRSIKFFLSSFSASDRKTYLRPTFNEGEDDYRFMIVIKE